MFNDFLNTKFLFQINRVQIQPVDKFFLLVGVVAFAIAVILKLAAKFSPSPVDSKYRNKLFNVFYFYLWQNWFGTALGRS